VAVALISIENVLSADDRLQGKHPLTEGIRFVAAMRSAYKIILSSLDKGEAEVKFWLELNGLRRGEVFEGISFWDHDLLDQDSAGVRLEHLQRLRRSGGSVDLVVDSDPRVVAAAVREGAHGLLWASPVYVRPEMRHGKVYVPQPWAEVEAETERQLYLKRTDPRLIEPEASDLV
jgi:hypothetical protein